MTAATSSTEHAGVSDSIEDVLAELRAGRMVIVTDDIDRENEGDLIFAAEKATPELVAFMVRYTSGVVCVPMEGSELDRLSIPLMTPPAANAERMRTAYTVSIDAAQNITTGISAADRAQTIRLLSQPSTMPSDFVRPGHVFPLRYCQGGVLRRAGHTEAAVDLVRLAGLRPAGVLAEIANDDGTMARMPELMGFKQRHGLKLCTIRDLIAYRRRREQLVERLEVIDLATDYGDFVLHLYRNQLNGTDHVALVKGQIDPQAPVLVRVHTECLVGDVLASRRCDCASQLHAALRQIESEGAGVLVYLKQNGNGAKFASSIHAYTPGDEDSGNDTTEQSKGSLPDLRDYGLGAQILWATGVREFRLLTNNPRKVVGLEGYGMKMTDQVPLKTLLSSSRSLSESV